MQRIGPYELIHRIASGGMAEVWMGRRQAMGGASKAVAVKLLASHLARKPVYRRMFVDEARLTMMLTHSNVVQVFDVGEQGGRSYLVMEWIDGLDLSRLGHGMREAGEAFSFGVIAHVIGEVLRGLSYAHELTEGEHSSTVVHRDISPHNVLISVSGEVKISDFGVARLASEETSGVHVRGKLRYMPPEQVRGLSKHATVDLFAVGAMMQELLDGTRFRAGLERDELFAMVIAGEVPPLERTGVPAPLVALRDALLHPDREQRVQSAREALAFLCTWSGYRNASDELAELVRGRAGVSAPRTGLTLEVSDDELERVDDEPTMRENSSSQASSQVNSQLLTRAHTRTDASGSETTPTPAPHTRTQEGASQRRPWRRLVAGASLGLAVLAGFGAASFSQAGSVEPRQVEAQAQLPSKLRGTPAPASLMGSTPALDAAGEHARVEGAPGEATRVLASAPTTVEERPPAREEPALSSARPGKVAAKLPAQVEFAAHEFFFVWVKVAGKQRALEPLSTLELPPGRHKVWLRETKQEPWRAAGHIKVAPGKRYRVSLRRPTGLKIQPG